MWAALSHRVAERETHQAVYKDRLLDQIQRLAPLSRCVLCVGGLAGTSLTGWPWRP